MLFCVGFFQFVSGTAKPLVLPGNTLIVTLLPYIRAECDSTTPNA